MTEFDKAEICNLGPDSLVSDDRSQQRKTFEVRNEDGQWLKGCSAGGCRNFPGMSFCPSFGKEVKLAIKFQFCST